METNLIYQSTKILSDNPGSTIIYEGRRNEQVSVTKTITFNDGGAICLPLNPRNDLVNHSPDGFNWGYSGSGPSQLALAILADFIGDDNQAIFYYQEFKVSVVSKFKLNSFTLTGKTINNFLLHTRF